MKTFVTLFSILFLAVGCMAPVSIPMSSNLNDFIAMSTKSNTDANVSFIYTSDIQDGIMKPYTQDKADTVKGHVGLNHTQSSTFERMAKEYLGNKFLNMDSSGSTTIKLHLKDFWVEQYSTTSAGMQALAAFGGGEINYVLVARAKSVVTVNHNGEENTKVLSASSENNYVQGIGTGTSTSNIYQGTNSIEFKHAENINKCNNKMLMAMNSFLESLDL